MRSISINKKMLVGSAGLVFLFGIGMIVMTETVIRSKLESKLEKRGIAIARSIARNALDPLLTERTVDLALLFKDYERTEEDIVYIYVLNARGAVVAHTFADGVPAGMDTGSTRLTGQPVIIRRVEFQHESVKDIVIPLLDGNAGNVHVGMSLQGVLHDIDDIAGMVITAVLFLIAAGTALAALLAGSLSKPLRLLARAAQGVERGDLSVRVPMRSDDEVGRLGAAFNSMAEARMRVEEMRAASEKKLKDITASLGEGVFVLNREGHLVFMNPEAERLLGWSEQELSGKDIHTLIHYQHADRTPFPKEECPSFRVFAGIERVLVDDDVFSRKDGKLLPVTYVSTPVIENGTVVSAVIAFRDITDRKQREADREQLMLAYEDALSNIKTLKGLIPICASCKSIRDDSGYWRRIEAYIHDHSDAEFSHGMCPECARKLYPDYYKRSPDNPEEVEEK